MTHKLPHDDYIEAVVHALTEAGLEPPEHWTDDGETRGVYCYLNAVITLDPSGTYELYDEDVPSGTSWRHGLILSWEWHTGLEEGGDPEKGAFWEFAALKEHSVCQYPPVTLPVLGYASPAAVVEAARHVIAHRIKPQPNGTADWDGGIIGGSWDQADALDTACEAWGKEEGNS